MSAQAEQLKTLVDEMMGLVGGERGGDSKQSDSPAVSFPRKRGSSTGTRASGFSAGKKGSTRSLKEVKPEDEIPLNDKSLDTF